MSKLIKSIAIFVAVLVYSTAGAYQSGAVGKLNPDSYTDHTKTHSELEHRIINYYSLEIAAEEIGRYQRERWWIGYIYYYKPSYSLGGYEGVNKEDIEHYMMPSVIIHYVRRPVSY